MARCIVEDLQRNNALSPHNLQVTRSSWSLEVWSRPRFFSLYYKVNLLLISRTPDLLKLLISRSKYTVPLCVINENLLLITRSVAWLTPSRLKGWSHGITYLYNGIFVQVHEALLGFAGQLHRLTINTPITTGHWWFGVVFGLLTMRL